MSKSQGMAWLITGVAACMLPCADQAQGTPSPAGTAPAPATQHASTATLDVVVTVPPLKGLIERLLPPGSRVTTLMKPGRSEHGYEMTAEDVVRVAKADIFVYVGAGLEAHVEKVLDKRRAKQGAERSGVVCFAEAVGDAKVNEVQGHECTDEHHDHAHTHGASAGDPHLWLDPVLVKDLVPALAQQVESALKAKGTWSTDEEQLLTARKEKLLAEVDVIDALYRERLNNVTTRSIITHHDAFSRIAKRYGLHVAAVVRVGTSGESSPGDLAKVIEAAKESGAQAIFREPQYDAKAVERLAARAGLKVLVLDPLGDGDWFAMMRQNCDALADGLTTKHTSPNERK